ncbi:MAG: hypothetical protein E6J03_03340 [Chloroflexi bacterium]|nr:MAG: hypothetical protein E6J03_03340 [Chloroflexota bacterium]
MPVREIIGKGLGFGIVSLSCILGGVLVFYGPHAYNDYFNVPLAIVLLLMGVGSGGAGVLIIGGIIADARVRRREARLHVTPRPGPAGPPPAWGMGDVGRPPSERGGGAAGGGGGPRLMSIAVSNIDGPLMIGFLLIWTLVACIIGATR